MPPSSLKVMFFCVEFVDRLGETVYDAVSECCYHMRFQSAARVPTFGAVKVQLKEVQLRILQYSLQLAWPGDTEQLKTLRIVDKF